MGLQYKTVSQFSTYQPTGPIRSRSSNVRPFVVVPFPCDSPRGAKEVPGEQIRLPPCHQYPEKLYITIGPQSKWSGPVSHCGINTLKKCYT